ncbi:hypothetical protein MUN89_15890 [Halobacillus salinarum]|uniref:Phosphoribosyltransferase domain-containing protein n=1 Tax=Halobacillus salinarum TaxID=2932257 RepID=A0ABY4EFY4_9BACI|nr:hypothetical protein [Halobacillus salinarum]UOQ43390.1 hypothetical protein MUN89_15890 [Halobacillus salinarum]
MVFLHKNFSEDTLIKVHNYFPYRNNDGSLNESFDRNSGLILDVKEGKLNGINYFYEKINPKLIEGIPLSYVPSSNSENKNSGIRKLVQKLASNNRVDATNCLDRHQTIQKAALGGPRNEQVHYNSIKVVNHKLIINKEVLLIDDITTTGTSLRACKNLLLQAGARQVFTLALGKTKRD